MDSVEQRTLGKHDEKKKQKKPNLSFLHMWLVLYFKPVLSVGFNGPLALKSALKDFQEDFSVDVK